MVQENELKKKQFQSNTAQAYRYTCWEVGQKPSVKTKKKETFTLVDTRNLEN